MAEHDNLPYIVVERRSGGFASFLWGALLGAAAALLLAPRSGEETRRELRRGVKRLRESAEGAVRQMQESLGSTVDGLRDQLTDRVLTARQAVEAGRDAARRARADLERRIEAARAERAAEAGEGRAEPEFTGEDFPA